MIKKNQEVTLTYDEDIDAAYIYLVKDTNVKVSKTYPCDLNETGAEINLDFDSEGRLVGIEILDAKGKLSKDILEGLSVE